MSELRVVAPQQHPFGAGQVSEALSREDWYQKWGTGLSDLLLSNSSAAVIDWVSTSCTARFVLSLPLCPGRRSLLAILDVCAFDAAVPVPKLGC